MTQALGLMSSQNTNSQPNLQQYNLINSIQQQQIIQNQIVIQPQDIPGAQGSHLNQNMAMRKGAQQPQLVNVDHRRESMLFEGQPLSDRCYTQSSSNRDLFQHQYQQLMNQKL